MVDLPIISGKDAIKVLGKIGYRPVRQRGSHIRLACLGRKSITIPNYKSLGPGLLRKILRDAEITTDEFSNLL